ncbi:MAG: FitA-like ribbon-helix-helix domain-containing protein [Microbacteriaceae bacterium]
MVSITIRNIPQETRDLLAERAAGSGRSLQEYLALQLAGLAARPSVTAAVTEIRSRARNYPSTTSTGLLNNLDQDRR